MTNKLLFFALLGVAAFPGMGATIAVSRFDDPVAGVDGWTVINDATGPTYFATGGNPGGYIQAVDQVLGLTWFWVAPPKFLGNDSAAYGQNLQFDLRQSGLNNQFDEDDVVLMGSGLTLAFDTPNNPGITWTSYNVPLLASAGWKLDSIAGAAATEAQMQSVLSNLTALRIRGEFITGPDTGDLDNVALGSAIPESGTLLLSFSAVLLFAFRYKRKQFDINCG